MGDGFYDELLDGRIRWDLLRSFPRQQAGDRAVGDAAVADLDGRLADRVDPEGFDRTGQLPDGTVKDLSGHGYLSLGVPPGLGGLGLSDYNAFRVIEAAARWSPPVGLLLAIGNGLGAGAYLRAAPPGPLRDFLAARLAAGTVSGTADTEPDGAANTGRATVAVPLEDGQAFLLHGDKVFAGNATVADLLAVSATVPGRAGDEVRLFFVDTASPGLRIGPAHEFLGLRGAANGTVSLDGVRVPRERMFPGDSGWRQSPELVALTSLARLYIIAAPSVAIARQCVEWSERFVARRRVDGRPLDSHDHVHHMLAASRAETFAIESVVDWALLGAVRVDTGPERAAAKNICSALAWRVVDRTMSLLAAEGYESAPSKRRRGADPIPLERAFRDARALRIAGGVDFLLDTWAAEAILSRHYATDPATPLPPDEPAFLPSRLAGNAGFVARSARAFAATCRRLVRDHPDPARLYDHQRLLAALNRQAAELLTMSLVMARAADLGGPAEDRANTYCTAAQHRVTALRHEVTTLQPRLFLVAP